MNILDFHTHIFPDDLAPRAIVTLCSHSPESKNYTDGTKAGLLQSMQQNNISQSVVLSVATKPSQVSTINRSCLNIKSEHLIPFGAIHPDTENVHEELAFLKSNGIYGIKLHPEYQNFYIDAPEYFPIYETISDLGLILLFHAGKDPGPFSCDHVLPPALKKVHCNFPNIRMVAAHMGGWKLWDQVEEHLCGLPVFFDTSAVSEYIPKEQFLRIVKKHGAEHILFGTDSPWFDQGDIVKWIDSINLSDTVKEMIFEKNGRNLLNLVQD